MPKHGDIVVITGFYQREDREWKLIERPQAQGIYLGKRTISDGYMDCEVEEGYRSYFYVSSAYKQAALVSLSARTNPVYVPFSHLIWSEP